MPTISTIAPFSSNKNPHCRFFQLSTNIILQRLSIFQEKPSKMQLLTNNHPIPSRLHLNSSIINPRMGLIGPGIEVPLPAQNFHKLRETLGLQFHPCHQPQASCQTPLLWGLGYGLGSQQPPRRADYSPSFLGSFRSCLPVECKTLPGQPRPNLFQLLLLRLYVVGVNNINRTSSKALSIGKGD